MTIFRNQQQTKASTVRSVMVVEHELVILGVVECPTQ